MTWQLLAAAGSTRGGFSYILQGMNAREKKFVQTVWEFYRQFGRHDLPWRQTTDPYCVMVSEIMLQQTQVDRVIPKYLAFVAKYPSAADLAAAQTADVPRVAASSLRLPGAQSLLLGSENSPSLQLFWLH